MYEKPNNFKFDVQTPISWIYEKSFSSRLRVKCHLPVAIHSEKKLCGRRGCILNKFVNKFINP